MPTYHLPERWFDKDWEEDRHEFLEHFELPSQRRLSIVFERCQWIDLLPLADLLLQIAVFCHRGGSIILRLGRTRSVRFLLESGFLSCLSQIPDARVVTVFGREQYSLEEMIDLLGRIHLPAR